MRSIRFLSLVVLCLVSIALLPHVYGHRWDWVSPSDAFAQEKTNTYYVSQFSGADVGTKITNAQAQCGSTLPCVIVIDSILAGWPQGTTVTPCGNCVFMDWRGTNGSLFIEGGTGISIGASSDQTSPGVVLTSNGVVKAGNGFQPIATGGATLGTSGARFSQLNIGDASGGVRWIGTGVYTALRTLTVPDGPSGTVVVGHLTTTASASDNVTIQGILTGTCTISPINASAATNIATTFISGKSANTVTVSHASVANMSYDLTCVTF